MKDSNGAYTILGCVIILIMLGLMVKFGIDVYALRQAGNYGEANFKLLVVLCVFGFLKGLFGNSKKN